MGLSKATFTVKDFVGFGQRHGIDYVFGDTDAEDLSILKGRVVEAQVRPGWQLTFSDVDVLHSYASSSTRTAPLFICVVLEGVIDVAIDQRQHRLSAGSALSARLAEQVALCVHQAAGQRLRTLNLSLDQSAIAALGDHPEVAALLHAERPDLHIWPLPGFLTPVLEQAVQLQSQPRSQPQSQPRSQLQSQPRPSAGQRQLMLEAICLQLLSHGLAFVPHQRDSSLSPTERKRLEDVRRHLHEDPAHAWSLEELATLASMSSSSLRTKFQRCFATSLFDYLRERRLLLAHELLSQGTSVQQAAFACGYGHTSNFSTAFRRRFGIPPSALAQRA
ncbi:AraC family transcriptional regulator [Halomonas binhaiensis]|uniref:Helix-turn-helix transcriptional regulator n=1 Tax=Halomonas binhaiensis TaxID=2562282 RepID=A0A5C1NGB9_9GAMM|nr:AraC family transcriptional regulator [Halomonas binhaiensis]QEM82732.1 helix-turn-helix transcriptional regulator [Halomonas binhaiensis]